MAKKRIGFILFSLIISFNLLAQPTVTSVTPSPTTITDSEDGGTNFSLAILWSEAMNPAIIPVVAFNTVGEDPVAAGMIAFSSGAWSGGNQTYTVTYTVTDTDTDMPDIDVDISGGQSAGGTPQGAVHTEADNFSVKFTNPTVTGAVVNVNPITDADIVPGFSINLTFSENMNPGIAPVITFPVENPATTISTNTNSWPTPNTEFQLNYTVADNNDNIPDIDIRVTTATDTYGNLVQIFNLADLFSIDMNNASVTSVTPSTATITDANVGAGAFTLTVVYNKTMNMAVIPAISFPTVGEDPLAATLSNFVGAWSNNTTFVGTYNVADANEEIADIDVRVVGGQDPAGNAQNQADDINNFSIDMLNPTVTLLTPNLVTITDVNTGAGNFTITVDFSENMITDGTANPTIAFPTENPLGTITLAGAGAWSDADTYVATYNVADAGENITDIDVRVTLATDVAGNTQIQYDLADVFSINMDNPVVVSVTPNIATITDANVGPGAFTITVVYNQAMNTGIDPVISYPTGGEDPLANTLTYASGNWPVNTTFVATYNVADANEAIPNIDIRVDGAQDVAANSQIQYNEANNFSIDTDNPDVLICVTNINPITDADAGAGNFTITLTYSENMDGASTPNISFPVENPLSTITFASGSWTDLVTYEAIYNVADANQTLADIDLRVTNANDPVGNGQNIFNSADHFSIDMLVPSLNPLAIISNNTNNTSLAMDADVVTITFTANETLSALPTATIGGQAALVANTGGLNYTATRTIDESETEGLAAIVINYSDVSGNPGSSTNADISNGSSVTLDFTAPANQDVVFAADANQYGGTTVTIVSSGDVTNKVWFAPFGQVNEAAFIAGTTMTQAANGTSNSILAPANAGSYYIYVIDEAGNVSNSSTAILTVVNTPVLDNIELGSLRYIEGDPPTQMTNTITVEDDSDNIISATIQITGNYQNGEDVLAYTGGFASAWTAATGTLTITGPGTKAQFETALRAVTYQNTSVTPSNLIRTVSFTIDDGTEISNTVTRNINLTPTLSVPGDNATIQVAINAAINGDRILISNGIYNETINFNGKQIEIIGNVSNPNLVVIDGGTAGSVVTFNSGETNTSILRGFTIQNGSGTLIDPAGIHAPDAYYGGGIYCNGSSPVLTDLIITNNSLSVNGFIGSSGGGVYLSNNSDVQFTNVTISNNLSQVYRGGGICIDNSNPVFNQVTITNNTTGNYGGGLAAKNSSLNMTDVTITNNIANGLNGRGGGMFLVNCTHIFTNVVSNGNSSTRPGNGVCTYNTPTITIGPPNAITDTYVEL